MMAFFVADMCCRLKEKAFVLTGEIKSRVLNNERYKKGLSWVSTLNIKKSLPVYVVAAMLLTSGVVWAGKAVSEYSAASAGSSQPAADLKENVRPHYRTGETLASRGGIDRSDRYLMARVIEGEAADEPLVGKVAVGAVIINRTESGEFPKDVKKVVYQPLAFEAVANGQYMRPVTRESLQAADMAIKGSDPTDGALYYWNPVTARSKWVWQKPITKKIGKHVFAE